MIDAPYLLFDVFTDVAFAGNQLAVFPEALPEGAPLQAIARELNLSETVFLGPATGGAAASLRIFTPLRELRFAGHPTIGAAIALADRLRWPGAAGDAFVLQLGVGDVPIAVERTTPTTAWLTTPPVTFGRTLSRDDAAAIAGVAPSELRDDLPPQLAGSAMPFFYVPLKNAAGVDRASLDVGVLRRHLEWEETTGVYLFAQTPEGAYARMLAPMAGISEDPATGSATGPLYAYLARHGAIVPGRERYVAEQGVAMGRRSVLHVRLAWQGKEPSRIEIGGNAVFMGEGRMRVPAPAAA